MNKNNLQKRILFAVIGVFLLAIGLQFTIGIEWGVSMFDTSTLVVERLTGLNFGNAAVVLHTFYLALLIIFMKKLQSKWVELGLSLVSIFLLTRVINAFSFIAKMSNYESFIITLIVFVISVFVFNIGIYFMSKSNLFISPYDRFVLQLSWALNSELGISRLISDVSLFTLTLIINIIFSLGVTVSIGTAYIIFTSGFQLLLIEKIFKIEDNHQTT